MNTGTTKVIGISDEVTTCECCGRTNLKRTVALSIDGGPVVHYGCDCAAKSFSHAGYRRFDAAAVKELGQWANKAAKYGTDAVIARYGNRSLELAAR